MTEVLAGIESETVVRSSAPAARVLDVLSGISQGRVESTQEISNVYGEVKELVERVSRLNGLGEELNVQPSSYLIHLDKMREIEEEISG